MMKNKKLFSLLLWSAFASMQAAAQTYYLHSDTQGIEWTVVPEAEVGTRMQDFVPLMQKGYHHPKAIKAVVPGTVFTSYVEAGQEKDPNFPIPNPPSLRAPSAPSRISNRIH